MNKLEKSMLKNTQEGLGRTQEEKREEIRLKEYIFRNIIENKAIDAFLGGMVDAGFSIDQINHFSDLATGSNIPLDRLFSYSYEIRKRMFPYFKKKIDEGKMTIDDFFKIVKEKNERSPSRIAYHCSPYDINPKKYINPDGFSGEEWVIEGRENDHRDDDLPMAYYSFDYNHLYREKNPRYLYLVESTPEHRTDGVEWGRAPVLSIIDKLDLQEVTNQVNEQYQEYKKDPKQAA